VCRLRLGLTRHLAGAHADVNENGKSGLVGAFINLSLQTFSIFLQNHLSNTYPHLIVARPFCGPMGLPLQWLLLGPFQTGTRGLFPR
jgi:hypothetical protein